MASNLDVAISRCINRKEIKLLNRAWWSDYFFGCKHSHLSRVFHGYQVCLDCGQHIQPKVKL